MSKLSQIAFGLASLALAMILSGCGGDEGLDQRYTISGKVTYNGEPLKKGKISFAPEDTSKRQGSGDIEDGEIVNVTTLNPGDGLLPGKYKVLINALEAVDLDGVTKKYRAAPDQVAVGKSQAKAKSLIPKKYNNAADSGLTAEVTSSSRSFTFELKD